MKVRLWIRRLLTRRMLVVPDDRRRKVRVREDPPSEWLEDFVLFASIAIVALTAVEVAHILALGTWNNEVFSAITGLIGTVSGIIIGRKT